MLPSSPPVRIRSPSLVAARMPPPCTTMRSGAPSRGANRSASSPSTNTGVSPRKYAATTGAPAAIGRARPATEAVFRAVIVSRRLALGRLALGRLVLRSRRAFLEALADHALRQLTADEHDPAFALFGLCPFALVVAVEHHMDALEHEPLRVALEGEDAFGAQNPGSLLGDQVLDPGEELVGVDRLVGPERQRLHVLVMVVREAAVVVGVAVAVIVRLIVIVVMVVIVVIAAD